MQLPDPVRSDMVLRFPTPVRLTPEGIEPALYAIGRTHNDLLVESRYADGECFPPRPLGGYMNHAPHLYASIPASLLCQLFDSE